MKSVFKITGESDRFEWWLTTILASITVHEAVILSIYFHAGGGESNWFVLTAAVALSIAALWTTIAVTAKRFRDCGFSPWFTLTAAIPVVGEVFILVVCGFFPTHGLKKRRLVRRVVN